MKQLILLCLIALAIACDSPEQRPQDLLDRGTFKDLLVEAQLIEARVQREMTVDKLPDIPVKLYYAELFKARSVSEESFRRTFQWYAEHPDELKAVYTHVLTELQRRSDTIPQ